MAQIMGGMRVAGVTARCDDACPEKVGALWTRFWQENVMSKSNGSGMYAVYYEYDPHNRAEYTVLIGSAIQDGTPLAQGLCEVTVHTGLYDQVNGPGDGDADVQAMWKQIREGHLNRAYITDYEDYGSEGSATIYVGLNPQGTPPATPPSQVH